MGRTVCWCTASNNADKRMTFLDYLWFICAEMIIIYLYVLVTFSSVGSINTFSKAAISSTFFQNLSKLKHQNTGWWWHGWIAVGSIRYVFGESIYDDCRGGALKILPCLHQDSFRVGKSDLLVQNLVCYFNLDPLKSSLDLEFVLFSLVFHYLSLHTWVQKVGCGESSGCK